jgi:F-type H+-transporting ATPase subunit delta
MAAVSRESYAAAAEQLESHVSDASAEALIGVADELLAVAGLLRREPRLRRALADPARSGEERGGLLRDLLSGKVGDQALGLAVTLASGRWSRPSELLDATEQLAVAALLASAERSDELGEVEDELFRFGHVVDGSPQLGAILGDPVEPIDRRTELVRDLLSGKARTVTVRLTELALAGFGGRGFASSLGRMVELAAARRDRQVAYVTAASALSDEEEARLGSRLSEMYGRQISLRVTVDPRIIGGLSVRIGSDLYDGTVLRRLTEARTVLTR